MREIGGYLEFERYYRQEFHKGCMALNSGRNCLAYLIEARGIKHILLPRLICDSIVDVCAQKDVEVTYYSVGQDFKPVLPEHIDNENYVYIINYYGQLDNEYLGGMKQKYPHMIVDNVQAFFQEPISNIDTIYSCRKFFGVADGAYLYSSVNKESALPQELAYDRMNFLLGRFENTGNMFFQSYQDNEKYLSEQDVKKMSPLTQNILKSIDYERVKDVRQRNYKFLDRCLKDVNALQITIPIGPYIYPLMLEDAEYVRERLLKRHIYVPVLWPNVLRDCMEDTLEYYYAKHILPIACDQRYSEEDMMYLVDEIKESLGSCVLSGRVR